jgi:hypothetical protein
MPDIVINELKARVAELERVLAACQMKIGGYKVAYDQAEQELAVEVKNKQQFERDWLECCDALAAAQTREKVLRDALELLVESVGRPPDGNCSCHISPPCNDCVDYGGLREAFESVDVALAQPTDDSALKAAMAAERGRCIAAIIVRHENGSYKFTHREECVEAIFALGDDQ